MSEIKFRLPIKLNGQKSLLYYNLKEIVVGGGINLSLFDWYGDFQLFTGLNDNNGREIYEGDILKHQYCHSESESISVVRWSKEDEDNHPGFCITSLTTQGGEITVVGNIFETPELCKEN